MVVSFRGSPRPPRWRRLALGLAVTGWPLVPTGCAQWPGLRGGPSVLPARATAAARAPGPATGKVVPAAFTEPAPAAPKEGAVAPATAANPGGPLPINLDTVFRLAEENNAQIALARERLHESQLQQELACRSWMPNVYAGVGYYRHEGGVQNEDGTLTRSSTGALFPGMEVRTEFDVREATYQRVASQRQFWQQHGELTRVSNETLLEAAGTYIDLLTARRGEAVARRLGDHQLKLLKRAEETLKSEAGARVAVENVRAEISRREQALAQLHAQGDAAAAKLVYLLGLPPETVVEPVDEAPVPIDLVDATPETADLVNRALAGGPGVRELEALMGVVQSGLDLFSSPLRFLPTLQMNMIEGGQGAGPGARLDWDNRWDVGLQARVNLTEFVTAREKRRLAESKLEQVRLSYQDLRGKLAAGVKEARETILIGRDQVTRSREQIGHADEAYRLSDLRLRESVPGSTVGEVLQSIGGLERAHFSYLTAVSAYNKAQVRLMLLLGPCSVRK